MVRIAGGYEYHPPIERKGSVMKSIKEVLMDRDGMSESDADLTISEARGAMNERLANGEMPFDICQEYFGLEEDYLDQLV